MTGLRIHIHTTAPLRLCTTIERYSATQAPNRKRNQKTKSLHLLFCTLPRLVPSTSNTTMSAISTVFSDLKANKELIPLVTFVGSAVTFGVAAMIHTSVSAKDVVFHHRSNPFPWQSTNQPATPPVGHHRRP
ncbi:hypothetical protein CAOG_002285 [Capsaspora owczarzaki ATCC 30864]|uniref:Uncharacterized protein n=1 Tax=Capsaspora owczarzaki (strain ATCC 30864) TaxID=595528 RepID=A0A0D2VLW7_CAPO3|nr:hypothetical protein CAOG_002285 [Capsaspora owczarzaki ATCC 30864]